ncbi:TonB-dependent receptor [Sphingomonas jatrophae]|uniref:Iron complex outermembrane recepter protein n=1 Tax=Sphingomonas jatrophae TaxID=1166337 RepID=A0A1I6KGU2_9SPHN|nr:TonB-dependent receptor [Sphingomonas jatrophae]SFR90427.1 iron complex outermembrane recepter protein [Sphingomonas jatrophae]
MVLHNASLLVSASLLALASPGLAQTADPAPTGAEAMAAPAADAAPNSDAATQSGIADIVVTARRRAESLQNVPLSVTGISAATIEQRDITSVDRLNGLAPAVFITPAAGPTTSGVVFNIRGVGGSDATGVSDYPVATYVDGVLVSRPNALSFDLVELERIEVLRGPQGTLFGRNTVGGAVNIFTKKPNETFGIEEKLTYGTFNQLRTRTTLDTGVLGTSGISAKFAYSHEQRDGYIKNSIKTNSADPGARNADSVFAAVHVDAAPGFTIDLKGDYTNTHNAPIYQQLAGMNPNQLAYFSQSASLGGAPLVVTDKFLKNVAIADQPRGRGEIWGGALTMSYDLSDAVSLKSITGYRRFSEDQAVNNAAQGALLGRLLNGTVARVYLFDYPDEVLARDRQFTQEFQLTGSVSDFNYVLGLFYFDQSYDSFTIQRLTAVVPLAGGVLRGSNVVTVRDYTQKAKSYAAFGQVSYEPSFVPGLELTGGLRYTKDKKSLAQANFSNGVAQTPGVGRNDWSDVNWLGSANYRVSPQLLLYTRISSAYRAGGFDAGGAGVPNSYDPETAVAYEAGFKADLFDRRLRFNASVYRTDYKDLQISQFVGGTNGGRTQTVNAGRATFSGFELEATAQLTDRFTLNGAVGYVHPKYKEYLFVNPANNQIIDVADEVHLAHVPKTTWNAGAGWDAAEFGEAKLNLRVDYAYQSGTYLFPLDRVNPFNELIRRNAWHTLGARATLSEIAIGDDLKLTLQVFGDNLLDEKQRVSGVDFGALGFSTIAWGPDRRFGVTATVRY